MGGTSTFEQDIVNSMLKKFCFGKISTNEFTYMGISISHNSESKAISINQNQFISDLPIHSYSKQDANKVLNKNENNLIRKSTGQLNWISSQTRPDLSYDSFIMSTCLNNAKSEDAKYVTKVLRKAKNQNVSLNFSHLGFRKDLHFELPWIKLTCLEN